MDKRPIEEIKNDLIQKLIDTSKYIFEKQRKCGRGIVVDSKGHYVSAFGTASFLDYVKAVEDGQIKIKDKEYRERILKLIENNK